MDVRFLLRWGGKEEDGWVCGENSWVWSSLLFCLLACLLVEYAKREGIEGVGQDRVGRELYG